MLIRFRVSKNPKPRALKPSVPSADSQDAEAAEAARTVEKLVGSIGELQGELAAGQARIKELTLAAAAVTELRVVFDQPWMLRTTQHRLQGPPPRCRFGSALTSFGATLFLPVPGFLGFRAPLFEIVQVVNI